jgi:3-oxo-5-alpha-steroid 4-dehydrogenase 1
MNDRYLFYSLLLVSFLMAVTTFSGLFFIRVPYGRYIQRSWGPLIQNRLAWLIMETPAVLFFALFFYLGSASKNLPLWIFFGMWEVHYVDRAFIYPFRISDGRKKMPVTILLMGFTFNTFNASLNSNQLFTRSGGYPMEWLRDPRFIIGFGMFAIGFGINRWSDQLLRRLCAPGEMGYKIPYGGLNKWVSCPNYLGEIIEWTGWAFAVWTLPGLLFALWTVANLAPRARAHHAWYRKNFPDYPPERKALIPLIW